MDVLYPAVPIAIAGAAVLIAGYAWARYLLVERHWHPFAWLHIHLHVPHHKHKH